MKTGIHPTSHIAAITCSCGASYQISNTTLQSLHVEVCSQCHPFYTGKEKLMDTAGRVDKFFAKEKAATPKK